MTATTTAAGIGIATGTGSDSQRKKKSSWLSQVLEAAGGERGEAYAGHNRVGYAYSTRWWTTVRAPPTARS